MAMLPTTLIHPSDHEGCGHYRILQPGKQIAHANAVHIYNSDYFMNKIDLDNHGIEQIVVQRSWEPQKVKRLKLYKTWNRRLIYDLDDLLWNVPDTNPFKHCMNVRENYKSLLQSFSLADKLILSTEPLLEEMRKLQSNKQCTVLPNYVPKALFQAPVERINRLRVGWAGSTTHAKDLEQIVELVQATHAIYDWIFLGDCPAQLRNLVQVHAFVPTAQYYDKLKSLKLHVALCPLENNRFNECKSHIKLLEFSALSVPCITSNIYPYRENPCYIVKKPNDWQVALNSYDRHDDMRLDDAKATQIWAQKYCLENNNENLRNAWFD